MDRLRSEFVGIYMIHRSWNMDGAFDEVPSRKRSRVLRLKGVRLHVGLCPCKGDLFDLMRLV